MTNKNRKLLYMVQLALLTAVILVLTFTPIGYLKIGLLEITFLTIPVIVGAVALGPAAGAFLGGVFGVTSFMQCFGANQFGATLLAINPIFTAITCIVARVLMGYLCGLIFKAISKVDKTKIVSYVIGGLSGALLNTLFFMSSIVIFFGQTDYIRSIWDAMAPGANVLMFVLVFVGINGLVEAVVCGTVGALISKAVHRFAKNNG